MMPRRLNCSKPNARSFDFPGRCSFRATKPFSLSNRRRRHATRFKNRCRVLDFRRVHRRGNDSPGPSAARRHHSARAQPSAGRPTWTTCRAICEPSRCRVRRTWASSSRTVRWPIALGKALFWDMQVGSDGVQACASCHFRAGADPRSKNQVSPGLKHVPVADLTYSTGTGPNYQLEGRGLSADAARQSRRPRRARSGYRQQRRRVVAGHPSSRR